jgi:hypothetical protein
LPLWSRPDPGQQSAELLPTGVHGQPLAISLGDGYHFGLLGAIPSGVWFGSLLAVRAVKDDRGPTLVERAFEPYRSRRQQSVAVLARYGYFQLITWAFAILPIVAYSFYESPWSRMPPYVVNDVCDAPGITGTRYGACPGSPGFRMPGRHSLPGESP